MNIFKHFCFIPIDPMTYTQAISLILQNYFIVCLEDFFTQSGHI